METSDGKNTWHPLANTTLMMTNAGKTEILQLADYRFVVS